ncbi:TetR/AcrR family transcriptional regulator [Actinocorallia populi]|uniref:TetR/AcrR family transcriptional regulator n=1 Tax=Actinocorallia populi TaxID=2079200 RepID=UPI0013009195|nr:TetR/AcrR family transcriptional regulator [Actinocorallia populi]
MSMSEPSPRDRLLAVATKLFAELGYDQTSKELIADAAGLPASFITEEFGGKRQLYLEVFRQVSAAELALVRRFADGGITRGRYHDFLDDYLDYLQENPEHAALMLQRWLNDAADIREIEQAYVTPQAVEIRMRTAALFREGMDVEMMTWSSAWAAQVFTLTGLPGHGEGEAPRDLERFRRYLHTLADLYLKD